MARWISAATARADFSPLLDIIAETNEPIIIEEAGHRVAVVLSPEDFDRLTEHLWEVVDRIRARNADKDPDDVLRFVTGIVEEVRQERHGQRQHAAQRSD